MDDESLPVGGVTARKYAAVCMALGLARGALYGVTCEQESDAEEIKFILDITSTATIAKALGYRECEMSIIWDEHLSPDELTRIKGLG